MDTVLLVAYLLIVVAMIAVILIQRSEGGGLGMGGGTNGFMTARGSANVLTRTTAILAALFFVLAIALTVIKSVEPGSTAILDNAALTQTTEPAADATAPDNVLDALNQVQEQRSGESSPADSSAASSATDTTNSAPAVDSPALAVPEAPATTDTTGN